MDQSNLENSQLDESVDLNESVIERREIIDLAKRVRVAEKEFIDSLGSGLQKNQLIQQNNKRLFEEAEQELVGRISELAKTAVPEEESIAIRKSLQSAKDYLQGEINKIKGTTAKGELTNKLSKLIEEYSDLQEFGQKQTEAFIYIIRTALTEEIENLQQEKEQIQQQLFEKNIQYQELLEKGAGEFIEEQTREKIEELQKEKSELEARNIQLTKEINRYRQVLEQHEKDEVEKDKEFEEKEKILTKTNRELNQKVTNLQSELTRLREQEQQAQDKFISAQERLRELIQEKNKGNIQTQGFESEKQALEAEINDYKEQVTNLKKELAHSLNLLQKAEKNKSEGIDSEFFKNLGKDIETAIHRVERDQALITKTPSNIARSTNKYLVSLTKPYTDTSLREELTAGIEEYEEDDNYEETSTPEGSDTRCRNPQIETEVEVHRADSRDELELVKKKLSEVEEKLKETVKELESNDNIVSVLKTKIGNRENTTDMANAELTRQIGVLFSRDEKKEIPKYDGESKDVYKWIQEAERVANNNDWEPNQKIKFFSDRLEGEALEWHNEYMDKPLDNNDPPRQITKGEITYGTWKANLIKRFEDEADIERIKNRLKTLRQGTGQNVKSFIALVNRLYDRVHGKGATISTHPTAAERTLYNENIKLRDTEKKEIVLSGLSRNVREGVWLRIPANASYETVCKLACEVESIHLNKELTENKGLNALVAGISLHEQEQDYELKKQRVELTNLQKQIGELRLTENFSQGMDNSVVIANVDNYESTKTNSNEQSEAKERNFRSNSRSRSLDRNHAYSGNKSRSVSPEHQRYSRTQRERVVYNNNKREERPRFNNNWRDRSQSANRNQSQDRNQYGYRNQGNREQNRFNQSNGFRRGPNIIRNPRQVQPQNNRQDQIKTPFQKRGTGETCFFCRLPGHRIRE